MLFWPRNKMIAGRVVDLYEETDTYRRDCVYYGIYLHGRREKIGECDLRFGQSEELYYAGNIGYRIYMPYRGHGYAYEACLVLFQIAKEKYHISDLIITCSPENIASRKTLEKLNGTLVEENTEVPAWHWIYQRGETRKNIYRYFL